MEVDGGEVSLTNYGRTRDFLLRLWFNRSDVPASCTGRDFSPYLNRSGITSYVFRGIDESDTLRITEDWIYNSERQEIEW